MDQKIRQLMTMHNALHSRDDIDCMCQEKKKIIASVGYVVMETKRLITKLAIAAN